MTKKLEQQSEKVSILCECGHSVDWHMAGAYRCLFRDCPCMDFAFVDDLTAKLAKADRMDQ